MLQEAAKRSRHKKLKDLKVLQLHRDTLKDICRSKEEEKSGEDSF